MTNAKSTIGLTFLFLFSALVFSCKKKDSNDPGTPGGYPKTVNIEYRVTKVSGALAPVRITYRNESGGETTLENQSLPFSKKIRITVNKMDYVTLGVGTASSNTANASVKGVILVDDKEVNAKTESGVISIILSQVWMFQ